MHSAASRSYLVMQLSLQLLEQTNLITRRAVLVGKTRVESRESLAELEGSSLDI